MQALEDFLVSLSLVVPDNFTEYEVCKDYPYVGCVTIYSYSLGPNGEKNHWMCVSTQFYNYMREHHANS